MHKHINKIFFTFYFLFLFILSISAQVDSSGVDSESLLSEQDELPSEPPEKIHPFSIRLSAGVPNPISSELFRKNFIGIYEANLSFNLRIGRYFYSGIGANNSLLSLSNRTRFGSKTKMQSIAVFIRNGYDYYHSKKIFSSFFLVTGYKKGFYTGILNLDKKPQNPNFEFFYLQPGYSINFFSEERLTLGFYAAIQGMFWQFNPDQVNLSDAGVEVSKFSNNQNAGFWIIGLEMYIGIGKTN